MNEPIQGIADSILSATTDQQGRSLLPRWVVRILASLGASADDRSNQDTARRLLVHEAVALYRAASARDRQGRPRTRWQISPDGSQTVQVLPRAETEPQRLALRDLGNYIQLITMNHPGLAAVLETAYHQGFPYLVARLTQGARSLAQYEGQPLPPDRAISIATQVVEALEYAHHRGIIHGALNLDEIYVDERGRVNVLGVGLDQVRRHLNVSGDLSRSPLTPPEVARGGKPDTRSDVYAVAALLFSLLTGKQPTPGRPVRLAQELPMVPPAVDQVLTQALAEDPQQRFADLVEMSWALRMAIHSPRSAPERSRPRPSQPSRSGEEGQAAQQAIQGESHSQEAGGAIHGFPQPLPMPVVDVSVLDTMVPMPEIPPMESVEIPPPPEIPPVDWNELLRPLEVSHLSSLGSAAAPRADILASIPDPLEAAAQAARSTQQELEERTAASLASAQSHRASAAVRPQRVRRS